MGAGTVARTLIILVAVGLVTTACGRRGDLLTPTQAAEETRRGPSTGPLPRDTPPPPPVTDRPFVLDSLL